LFFLPSFSQDRSHRIRALRDIIALNSYDIILLQEVWFRKDYDLIRSSVPFASYFESFNSCSGYFLPIECSGLVVLSRHPIEHVEFLPFRKSSCAVS
jgi:endonuclease/exonuclease/phosphatase family metal-dependent hydrolase